MASKRYSKQKSKQPQTNNSGCLGRVVLYFLWLGFTSAILTELFPDEKQSGGAFGFLVLTLLSLPFWIKPLCKLIGKGIRAAISHHKERRKELNSRNFPKPPVASVPQMTTLPIQQFHTQDIGKDNMVPISETNPKVPEADLLHTSFTDVFLEKADKVQSELLTIDLMEGHQFEVWCAEALKACGFVEVSITPGSGDQGVDVLAKKDGIKYAIQCKRYTAALGNAPIQEVHSGKDYYRCHVGAVITNQHFTDGAIALAQATGTLLWDREWIKNFLDCKFGDGQNSSYPPVHTRSAPTTDSDELFYAAVDIVFETGQASISMLQRRLKLGYSRAARIVDEMEDRGIVGPFQGSTPRAILITHEQWQHSLRTPSIKE